MRSCVICSAVAWMISAGCARLARSAKTATRHQENAMAETVRINEVGLRDGLQNQPTVVPTAGKLELCEALIAAGITEVEAISFVSPKVVPQMADAADLFAVLPASDSVHYSALIPNEKGYERARAAGVEAIALVVATTDTFTGATSICRLARRWRSTRRSSHARTPMACTPARTSRARSSARTKGDFARPFARPHRAAARGWRR